MDSTKTNFESLKILVSVQKRDIQNLREELNRKDNELQEASDLTNF
jgi:hypothetical protein